MHILRLVCAQGQRVKQLRVNMAQQKHVALVLTSIHDYRGTVTGTAIPTRHRKTNIPQGNSGRRFSSRAKVTATANDINIPKEMLLG